MKALNAKTGLAAVTLAAATLFTPMAAQAGDYNKCKDTENAVAGGLIGGTLGTVIGEEIAGRGDRTEGAILGAVIGGIAGAAIGDGVNDCEKYETRRRRGYTTVPSRGYSSSYTTRPAISTVGYHGNHGSYGHNNYGHNSYGYNNGRSSDRLFRLDRRIDNLRRERAYIKRGRHLSRWEYRRLDEIGNELHRLKKKRKRIKREARNYRDYRDYRPSRNGHYHGRSSDICYSNH